MKSKKNYNKDFEYDKSGMTVFAYGNTLNKYYIRYVIEKSPASEADIRPGDIILKIGIFHISGIVYVKLMECFHPAMVAKSS